MAIPPLLVIVHDPLQRSVKGFDLLFAKLRSIYQLVYMTPQKRFSTEFNYWKRGKRPNAKAHRKYR